MSVREAHTHRERERERERKRKRFTREGHSETAGGFVIENNAKRKQSGKLKS